MDRRSFLKRGAAAATVGGFAATGALPAMAAEPTRPITVPFDIDHIQIFDYPNRASRIAIDGSGSLPASANLRFEVYADLDKDPTRSPSEHWDVHFTLTGPTGRRLWDASWFHANATGERSPVKIAQNNHYNPEPGVHGLRMVVRALESGQVFEHVVPFTVTP